MEEEDRYLLDEDFEQPGVASDDCKETWIVNMDTALSYAAHKRRRASASDDMNDTMDSNEQAPAQLDAEGSV